jgi:hypothetical protein
VSPSTHEPSPKTAAGYQRGDRVVWEDGRSGVTDIYGMQIGTGLEVRLTDNGAWNQAPTLRGDVMCFRTTLWGGASGWDLAVMDLSSGAVRRAIEQSSATLWKCAFVDSPRASSMAGRP